MTIWKKLFKRSTQNPGGLAETSFIKLLECKRDKNWRCSSVNVELVSAVQQHPFSCFGCWPSLRRFTMSLLRVRLATTLSYSPPWTDVVGGIYPVLWPEGAALPPMSPLALWNQKCCLAIIHGSGSFNCQLFRRSMVWCYEKKKNCVNTILIFFAFCWLLNPLTPNPYCTELLPCAEGLGGAAAERNKRFFPKITARLVFKIKSSFFSPFLVNGYILSCKCRGAQFKFFAYDIDN